MQQAVHRTWSTGDRWRCESVTLFRSCCWPLNAAFNRRTSGSYFVFRWNGNCAISRSIWLICIIQLVRPSEIVGQTSYKSAHGSNVCFGGSDFPGQVICEQEITRLDLLTSATRRVPPRADGILEMCRLSDLPRSWYDDSNRWNVACACAIDKHRHAALRDWIPRPGPLDAVRSIIGIHLSVIMSMLY